MGLEPMGRLRRFFRRFALRGVHVGTILYLMNEAANTIANEIADTFGAETLVHFTTIVERFAGHRSPVELRDSIEAARAAGLLAVNGQTVSVCPR